MSARSGNGAPPRTGWCLGVRTVLRSDPGLARRTGAGVTVAVIDSGANAPHPHLPGLAGGVAFDLEGRRRDRFGDRLGHGTAVAAAIHEKAPGAAIWAVKVFDTMLATSVPTLVRALDWASEQGAHLVNLSLGTPNPARSGALAAAVARAAARGTVIVSADADPRGGEAWYPGSLDGVVGVRLDWSCPRDGVRALLGPDGRPGLRASGYPRPIPGVSPERNVRGVSFAVANATGLLALALEGRGRPESAEAALARLVGEGGAPGVARPDA